MKRKAVIAVLTAVVLMLSGCSGFGVNISDALSPPKPSGELYEIQKSLESSVGHDVDLVYPSQGKYRSAIITKDIDSDGKYEVFSFYSTETDDKTTVMHINYIRWFNGEWVAVSDRQVECSGVESVDFVRLDRSATPKILVNWNRYSATNKQLSVYSIDSGELTEIAKSDYSAYSVCDFDADGISEIVAINLDTEEKQSVATLMGLSSEGFSKISTCNLDGTVNSYYTPVLSTFTDGTSALFIDADKATGMITEVLRIKDDQLVSAVPYMSNMENVNTLRVSSVRSVDYDGDGSIDIPLAYKIPTVSTSSEEDSAYMTVWNSFDGVIFKPIFHTVINYTDGYYFNIPPNWVNAVAVERRLSEKERAFYRWDPLMLELGEEILRIRAVPLADWENGKSGLDGYSEISRSLEEAFVVRFGSSALNPGIEFLKNNFNLITADAAAYIK